MKNRRTVVVAFLVAAVMLLGIGYAALTDTLTINGDLKSDPSASQNEFDGDIYFSATSIVQDDTGNQAASQILEGRDDAKIEAKHFSEEGQVVKVKFTITNDAENDFAAIITPNALTLTNGSEGTDHAHKPIFSATWSWNESAEDTASYTLQPGESKDLWVTITVIERPTDAHTATFSVSFGAEETEPAAND